MSENSISNESINNPDFETLTSVPFTYNHTYVNAQSYDAYETITGKYCPFGSTYAKREGENDRVFVNGGIVAGGETNLRVDDFEVNLKLKSNAEKWLFLEINFTAVEADRVLMPGVKSIQTAIMKIATDVPDNKLPKMLEPTGTWHIPLGRFSEEPVIPEGSEDTEIPLTLALISCGNIYLDHCPGYVSFRKE